MPSGFDGFPGKIPPGSEQALEESILHLGSRIADAIRGRYVSLAVVGGAARGENTFEPGGRLLSDVDFFVILPQRRVLTAWLAARICRNRLRKILPGMIDAEWITIGYGHSAPRFWKTATPFMLELRANARILSGSDGVRDWPQLVRGDQIPSWEGLRLIGNRLCELIGFLGTSADESFAALSEQGNRFLAYKFLKLILACSEAVLIDIHRYESTYRERMLRQEQVLSGFTAAEKAFIAEAYRAKLNSHPSFFQKPLIELARGTLQLAVSTLSRFGLAAPENWALRARMENPGAPGWITDAGFFFRQRLRGRPVPFRRAIADIYQDAHMLALGLLDNLALDPAGALPKAAYRRLDDRFRAAPQFVSIIRTGGVLR